MQSVEHSEDDGGVRDHDDGEKTSDEEDKCTIRMKIKTASVKNAGYAIFTLALNWRSQVASKIFHFLQFCNLYVVK
jgi:hypothetical protein